MEVVIQPSANAGATSGRDACIDGCIRPTRDSKVTSLQRQRVEHRVYHCNRNVKVLFPDRGREGRGCLYNAPACAAMHAELASYGEQGRNLPGRSCGDTIEKIPKR